MTDRERQDRFAAESFIRWLLDHEHDCECPEGYGARGDYVLYCGIEQAYRDSYGNIDFAPASVSEDRFRVLFDKAWRQYREHVQRELDRISEAEDDG